MPIIAIKSVSDLFYIKTRTLLDIIFYLKKYIRDDWLYCSQVKVSPQLCQLARPTEREPCHIPCTNDCVISEWSQWSACSQSCGLGRSVGYKTRARRVLVPAKAGNFFKS